ncbi:CBN-CDC-25.2 protein [Aphelenchoides avenae]|nr:CBN-CDC-25.2 protein [Aphelenchus avenae]
MDSEDVGNISPRNMTIDHSPDSGVSMGSKDSTPTQASTGVSALRKEPFAPKGENDSANLDQMEVDLSGEQLPEEQQLMPRRPILKAHRGADRVPRGPKLTIQFADDTNVYSPTSLRRPGTPYPRKGLMSEELTLVTEEHPSKRSRHSSVSIDTSLDPEDALSTPPPVAIPPNSNTIQLSSKLPSMPCPNSSAFQFIACDVLAERLSKLTQEQFLAEYILVDCRYPYEYAGGHIKYAINIHNAEELPAIFFPADDQLIKIKSRTPIFYCEFSQKRGPAMAQALRRMDRTRHEYPDLDHDTIYVLKDGYKDFFERGFLEHCYPAGYMTMDNPSHRGELIKYTAHKKKKRSLGVSEPPAGTSDDLEATNASSSLQPFSLAATNTAPHSPMLSMDFARARIDSPPITPKVKRPTKGEGRRLRFGKP